MTERLVLATHDSPLALARAERVADDVRRAWPALDVALEPVRTPGPATETGKGADAVRRAVLAGRADAAVHALRDLPLTVPEGLTVGAIPMRDDPRDALVSRTGKVLAYLPEGTLVGTSSPRQAAQLLRRRSDLSVVPIRGDLETLLARLDTGEVDAVVLSAGALDRLGFLDRISEFFDTDQMIPAPGQGAQVIEIRSDDAETARLLAPVNDEPTEYAITAERTCLRRLRAGPTVPVGVFAVTDGEMMFIHGIVATDDGGQCARLRWTGPWREAVDVGETLAELLLSAGAREILAGEPIETINFAELHRQQLLEDWDLPYPPEEA